MIIPSDLKKWLKMRMPNCVHSSAIFSYIEALEEDAGSKIAEIAKLENRIKQLEAVQPKWISVEERLPEDGAFAIFYYVKNDKNMMAVGCYFDYGMFIVDGHSVNVTHWMALPQPPKEEE